MKQKKTQIPITSKTLFKNRELFIFGDIDECMAFKTIKGLKLLKMVNNEPIKIYIHTDGGCTDAGGAIIDEMKIVQDSGIVIKTITQGKAYSYGAIIAALGTHGERYATPNSSFLLHEASISQPEDYLAKQEEYTKYVKKQEEIITKLLAAACGKASSKKYPVFVKDIEKSVWLTASEAIKYGLIDKIWTAKCL